MIKKVVTMILKYCKLWKSYDDFDGDLFLKPACSCARFVDSSRDLQ